MEDVQWSTLLQSPIIIIMALVIGTLGEVAKRTISANGVPLREPRNPIAPDEH